MMTPEETHISVQSLLQAMEDRLRADRAAGEERIRSDIKDVRADAALARGAADTALLAVASINGRVTSLEEKAGWVGAGFGATFLAMGGFIWHMVVKAR